VRKPGRALVVFCHDKFRDDTDAVTDGECHVQTCGLFGSAPIATRVVLTQYRAGSGRVGCFYGRPDVGRQNERGQQTRSGPLPAVLVSHGHSRSATLLQRLEVTCVTLAACQGRASFMTVSFMSGATYRGGGGSWVRSSRCRPLRALSCSGLTCRIARA
jgi:hypothetical protein